ncbi:MAG TPA: tetratricopeptide repeat protein [Stellaceae bacterium]|nr:tetratricopeptide repeat protein [Stellaceae bacterium]
MADISVYALIGRAGTGKTRLAIEFCRAIDNDPTANGEWVAGFLSPTDLNTVVETLATHNFAWERQTLLVVDYAAQCYEALARWLDRLALTKLDTRLRFLLLDREAPEAFGWWHDLTVLAPPSRRYLFHTPRPRQLPDLSDLEERRMLMTEALQAARELRPAASGSTSIPPCGTDVDFDHRLAQAQFGNPLNLVMAGVIALDRGPQAALALRRLDAARQIARRELRRLADLARSRQIGEDTIRHVVAFNGLAGGLPIADLLKTVADELTASHRSTDHLGELLTMLQQELPPLSDAGQQPRLATIQPDLIGEAAIVEAFTGGPSREAEAVEVIHRAYRLTGAAAAQSLIRIVQDFGYSTADPSATEPERSTGRRILGWLLTLAENIDDPEQLIPIVDTLPVQTTILREQAAELTQRLVAHFVSKTQENDDPLAVIYSASLFNNLSVRLSDLGRREEALGAAEEAVDHYRALAAARPDAFTADLALSLNNCAIMLSEVGRREEALGAAKEAVDHYRALAAARPDAFTPDLAMSLNNLAIRLSDLGRREEALGMAEEAVRHYRALAAARPDAFTPNLASSLNNLANRLSNLGRREEALAAAEEAVRLRRALAEARPDAFGAEFARCLWVFGDLQGDAGKPDRAVGTLAEAIRRLTPTFSRFPEAVAGIMNGVSRSYISQCEAAGREPDPELLGPVIAVFEKLKEQEEK